MHPVDRKKRALVNLQWLEKELLQLCVQCFSRARPRPWPSCLADCLYLTILPGYTLYIVVIGRVSALLCCLVTSMQNMFSHYITPFGIVSAYRYIAITNLPIIAVFVEYLGQFLIDFNQIYRHSSVP